MKLPVVLLFASLLSIAACKKSKQSSDSLSGLYTELTPVAGNTTMHFKSGGIMIRSESGSTIKDTFLVSYPENKISLKPATGNLPAVLLDFRIIDKNTIEIEYFGPMIPEAPKSFMVLRK